LSPNDTYPQHVVTAVIVAHDGAAWLPHVISSLLGQTRPVQRVVAVDTGSRDRSGAVLAGELGQAVVFGMERGTGYPAAVARALQHRAANAPVPGPAPGPGGERVEWLWLLHDDFEPAPDALEQLLRGAAEIKSAAVLGPKIMDWADREVILEAGVTIDTAGRRITGIEPREVDQGQHDGDRDSLAVGSAGMLVRRDVWDQVGGFDTGMPLFREDVDFCWRVHAAGYRVRVVTGAVAYHLEASARHRRPVSVARRPDRLNRRNALLTLFANLPPGPMLASLAGNIVVSFLRTIFFLVAKRPSAALDELAATCSVLGHPFRLLTARRRRSRGRRAAYGRLRADLPPGRSVRRLAEFAADVLSRSTQLDTTGSHHASEDPSEDDSMLVDNGIVQRILTNPAVLLFAGLTVIALVAERSLLSGGTLGGGALVPASGGAAGLWHTYLQGFHPTGVGSATTAPPYLAVIAALATIAAGKPWLAVDVVLLGCVPLAGLTAFLAARRITRFAPIRVWAAAAYALLPVAMGSIAAGRIGTAVVFVILPLIALTAARMFTQPPRLARRAAWATGLGVAVATAFVPLVWVIALIAAGVAALAFGSARRGMAVNLAIAAVVPPVLLMPWTIQVVTHPALLLLEAGVQAPGLASHDLSARSLMLLSPGGPGIPPFWVTGGIAVAALAALLLGKRRVLAMAGWGVALFGLLIATAVSRIVVTPPGGDSGVAAWPGVALTVVAIGLLLAATTAGDAIPRLLGGGLTARRGLGSIRGLAVILLAIAACSAPALAAASWVASGVRGPIAAAHGQLVPELVSVSSDNGLRLRTLVLRVQPGHVSYAVLRGVGPSLGDPDLAPAPAAQQALSDAVATLVAPSGGQAADQGNTLAQFDIGFVLMPAPVSPGLARLLDGVAGLRPVSATSSFDLWRLVDFPARVRVVESGGQVVPLRSGTTRVAGAPAPAAGGTLELAEPAGGWNATLNGHPLTPVRSPAGSWAQAFRLPAGGGRLSITRDDTSHTAALILEFVVLAVVAVLALPGINAAAGAPAAAAAGDSSGAAEPGEPAEPAGPPAAGPRTRARARGRDKGRSRRPAGKPNDKASPGRPRRSRPAGPVPRDGAAGGAVPLGTAASGMAAGGSAARGMAARGAAVRAAAARAAAARAAAKGDYSAAGQSATWPVTQHSAGPDSEQAGQPSWPAGEQPARQASQPASRQASQPASWPAGQRAQSAPWSAAEQPASEPAPWPPLEQPSRPAGQQASWPAEQPAGRAGQPGSWPGLEQPAARPGQPASWPAGESHPSQPGPWSAAGQPPWQAGEQPSWPAGEQPSWPAGEQPSWPAGEQPSWPAASQPAWQASESASWPAGQPGWQGSEPPPAAQGRQQPAGPGSQSPGGQPPGSQPRPRPPASPSAWPSDDEWLDPLPPAGGPGPGPVWQPSPADEETASRWPVPGEDRGDDRW
jgi:GT2 family glycosyltransferase